MEGDVKELLRGTVRFCLRGLLFAALLSCFINILQLMLPLYTLQVYDRVLSSRSVDTLTMLTILTVGALAFYGVLEFIRAKVFAVAGGAVSRRLNGVVLKAVVEESLRRRSAQGAQATRDLNDLRLFMTGPAVTVPLDLAWAPLFIAVLFLLHPIYGAIALGAAVILVCFGLAVELSSRRQMTEANQALAQSFNQVGVAVRNAEVVEAMGMMSALARGWQRSQNQALALLDRGSGRAKAIGSAAKSARMALQIAMIGTGVLLVLNHEATPGSIIAASIIMGRMLAPFEQLIDGWRQWVFAFAAYKRVRALLTHSAELRQSLVLPKPEGRLVVDRLSFLPPGSDRPVLRNVTFALEPGEVLGVIGPSASGKSTLARLLVGVWEPTAGGIYLDGNSVFLWERDGFGEHVGYLPQNVALLDGSIRENIARMRTADPRDVVAAARRAGVHEMIGRLPRGYDTEIGDGAGAYALSGGQRQRLGLARALFGDPRLLILDEPNANLDNVGEQALIEAISEAKARGVTVVVIAHRPAIMKAVDKILVLKEGVVERFGPTAEVLSTVTPPAVVQPMRPRVTSGGQQ